MVSRQQSPLKVTVVDLDGTYLLCNSLELYLKNALSHAARHLRLDLVARILTLFVLRRLRLISHETMKYRAIAAAGDSPEMLASFQRLAKQQINPTVAEFIEDRRKEGDAILLATAAAECYVPLIWHGEYIASPMGGPDCRRERKKDAVARWTTAHNAHISYFLTDHREDLPLARYAAEKGGKVMLVNPSPKSHAVFDKELPSNSILSLS